MQPSALRLKATSLLVATFMQVLFINSTPLFGQVDSSGFNRNDSSVTTMNAVSGVAQEGPYYAIGLGILLIGFAAVVFGVFLFISLLALLIILLFALLVSAGAMSLALLYGLKKRSATAAVKAMVYLILPTAAAGIGWVGTWLIVKLFNYPFSIDSIAIIGISGGFLAGFLIALALVKCSERLWKKVIACTESSIV